jgi:ABC-type Fe3+-siderophore transport system permease subunit
MITFTNVVILLFLLAVAFITGALSVHASGKWDWKVGDAYEWLRKRVVKAIRWRDRITAWFVGKKSRA